ncbi:hypothetical protein EDB19DRAFT_1646658, partial [Suillus lakei]
KLTSPSVENEITPSVKYNFKDYVPWVFCDLHEYNSFLDPADYPISLAFKYILSQLTFPGKSGSFLYFSRDYCVIVKTI